MTTSEEQGQTLREALGQEAEVRQPSALAPSVHRKFLLAYLFIAMLGGAALGAFVVLLARPDPGPEQPWSSFRPHGSTDARVKQIAYRVGSGYRFANGNQIVVAIGGKPMVDQIPVSVVAIRPDTSTGAAEEGDIQTLPGNDTVQYTLCGLGQRCTIPSGTPSTERGVLLTREAIELSLYTFKYVDSAKAVAVFLPPVKQGKKLYAPPVLLLRRGAVSAELHRPITSTFATRAPGLGGLTAAERDTIDRIAISNLYTHEYQQASDGTAILVLTPRNNTATGQ